MTPMSSKSTSVSQLKLNYEQPRIVKMIVIHLLENQVGDRT